MTWSPGVFVLEVVAVVILCEIRRNSFMFSLVLPPSDMFSYVRPLRNLQCGFVAAISEHRK